MSGKPAVSDAAFLEKQRARLLKLKAEVSSTAASEETEESAVDREALGGAHEFEDDAQRLALLEVEGTLVRHSIQRLPMIERALRKLTDGTYGFSDVSGRAIPLERLEAMPEAIYAADEEAAWESGRRE